LISVAVNKHQSALRRTAELGRPGGRQSIASTAVGVLLATLACISLLCTAPARAAMVTDQRPLLFAFDGSDATAGSFVWPRRIAVDDSTGAVYVTDNFDSGDITVSKFGPDAGAANFVATGTSSIFSLGNFPGVAVDNSGGLQGRIYVSRGSDLELEAFDSSGNRLWTTVAAGGISGFEDVAVDPAGHPWVVTDTGFVAQFDDAGTPPPLLFSKDLGDMSSSIDFDADGNAYLLRPDGSIEKYPGANFNAPPSILAAKATDVYVNRSTTLPSLADAGHLFVLHAVSFSEFEPDGALLSSYGAEYVGGGRSIAYDPSRDRVYVLDALLTETGGKPVVAAFGPATSGTVPDLTIAPASAIEVSSAHVSGMIDPQGQSGSHHFEWRRSNQSWSAAAASVAGRFAGSTAPAPLPAGPGPVAVEADLPARLRGNTAYQVRLVTVNDGDGLRSFSAVEGFTTATAPAPPDVTAAVSDVTTTAATVSGMVDPQGDTADWHVELTTDPSCAAGFSPRSPRSIDEATDSPQPVGFEFDDLLPAQRYCARIAATNSAGTAVSSAQSFETGLVPPTDALTAFAAPRTDTSARLNARVNPEGAALTYNFEYSADGGATWTALPDVVRADDDSRQPVIVSQELDGLSPDTVYRFRFFAANGVGPADPQGEELEFRTRPVPLDPACPNAEVRVRQHTGYLPDCRGIELVNNPDKGNQNLGEVAREITPDGEQALWNVNGGAPGGPNGAGNFFRAERTIAGWRSHALAPSAGQQLGEGSVAYVPLGMTPDFSRFILSATVPSRDQALVRLDPNRNQEILVPTSERGYTKRISLSDDGAHVVLLNTVTDQLEDVGAGAAAPPELLTVMPDGTQSQCGLNGINGFMQHGDHSWIEAAEASHVYFRVRPNGSCGAITPRGLYVRDREAEQTTLIDPGATIEGTPRSPVLIRVAPDGRTAYFATQSQLDPADSNDTPDVYRWQEAGGPECLTCVAAANANVVVELVKDEGNVNLIRVSDDFSHVYFVSGEKLAPGSAEGEANLYALSGGEIHLVTTIDIPPNNPSVLRDIAESFSHGSDLSADGEVVIFSSPHPRLTADPVAAEKAQLYRYDDRDGSLDCISCRRDGETTHAAAGGEMSSDGTVVAFQTAEPLSPLDVNGAVDLYRWREGEVELITDGLNQSRPQLTAVDADGSDIFFKALRPGWTGFEADRVFNFYDARVGGGFEPPAQPTHCEGDSCQGPLLAAPALGRPASSIFSGSRNVRPPAANRCAKKRGKAKRRCIERKRRKARSGHGKRRAG
jgi:DNA-binding beta-propeller fold protein YncE